jgi:hypothetical protein
MKLETMKKSVVNAGSVSLVEAGPHMTLLHTYEFLCSE